MTATLITALFVIAALAAALVLADCWARGRNAWRALRAEMQSDQDYRQVTSVVHRAPVRQAATMRGSAARTVTRRTPSRPLHVAAA